MSKHLRSFLISLKAARINGKRLIIFKHTKQTKAAMIAMYRTGLILSWIETSNGSQIFLPSHKGEGSPYLTKISLFSCSKKNSKHMNIKALSNMQVSRQSVIFISTNLGILTREECLKKHVGGIVLFCCD